MWPDGDESWYVSTPQTRRPNITIKQSPTVIPTLSEPQHNQSSTNVPDADLEVSVEAVGDHAESLENFATDISCDEISSHINEIERQGPKHPTEFYVYQHNKSPLKTTRPLIATTQQLQVESSSKKHLLTSSQSLETKISSHVLDSIILCSYTEYKSSSKFSSYFRSLRSSSRHVFALSRFITTHLTSWWLMVFTILLGSQLTYYPHDDLQYSETLFRKSSRIF